MNPVIAQTSINHPALPVLRAISALTIKIPEPIMLPATNIVASVSVSEALNPLVFEVIKLPAALEVPTDILIGQCGTQHLNRHVVFLHKAIVEFLDRHASTVHQFMFEAPNLQSAHQISQLIKRAIISFKGTLHFTMCSGRFVADPIYQIVNTLLRSPFTEVVFDRKRDPCTTMHAPEQHTDTLFRSFGEAQIVQQQFPVQGPSFCPKRSSEIFSPISFVTAIHKIL